MAQCVGRSQRTGERCKRTAVAGASTCSYHGRGAGKLNKTPRRVESEAAARTSDRRALATKVLSKRTCDDFETLFAVGTGWGGADASSSSTLRYRGRGATGVALRAAANAISRKGGGVVEDHATAIAPGPPPKPDRKGAYVDGDVVFWGGSAKVRFGVEVAGVGPVAALYRSGRSMHSAPLGGTVDLFRRQGFEAVSVLPRPKSALADRIVMRRTV